MPFFCGEDLLKGDRTLRGWTIVSSMKSSAFGRVFIPFLWDVDGVSLVAKKTSVHVASLGLLV